MADKRLCVCGKSVTETKSGEPRKHVCNAPNGSAWKDELAGQPIVPADVDETDHEHAYWYGDDDNGHSGSFCHCGKEQPGSSTEPEHVCTYAPTGRGTANQCACGKPVSDGPVEVPPPGKVTDDQWRMPWARDTGFRFKIHKGASFRADCGHMIHTHSPYRERPEGGYECRGEWKLAADAPVPSCMIGRPDTLDRVPVAEPEEMDSPTGELLRVIDTDDRPATGTYGPTDAERENWNGTGRPRPSASNVKMPEPEPQTDKPRLLDVISHGAGTVLDRMTPEQQSAALGAEQMARAFSGTAMAGVNDFLSPSQTGIGSGDANDFLSTPEPQALGSATGQPETERDRYGRYLVKDPRTGDYKRSRRGTPEGFTRATTYAKTLLDTYGLNQWEKRMVAVGMAMRPDLVQRARGLDVTADKAALEEIHEAAKEAAGGSEASSAGTEFHTVTEHLDAGLLTPETVPEEWRTMARAYADKMSAAGLTTRTEWIERITFTDRGGEEVTGTADRVLLERDGTPVIGDVKSGKGIDLAEREIAIQLLTYAMGVNQFGLYNKATKQWEPWTGPPVSEEYGIVMHVPVQRPNNRPAYCDLYRVSFRDVQGFDVARAMQAASWTRRWRKAKGFATPYSPPAAIQAAPRRTWAEAFASVTTPEEANRLWQAAVDAGMNDIDLSNYVQVARESLAALQSQ